MQRFPQGSLECRHQLENQGPEVDRLWRLESSGTVRDYKQNRQSCFMDITSLVAVIEEVSLLKSEDTHKQEVLPVQGMIELSLTEVQVLCRPDVFLIPQGRCPHVRKSQRGSEPRTSCNSVVREAPSVVIPERLIYSYGRRNLASPNPGDRILCAGSGNGGPASTVLDMEQNLRRDCQFRSMQKELYRKIIRENCMSYVLGEVSLTHR
jgi:hypothetical protein